MAWIDKRRLRQRRKPLDQLMQICLQNTCRPPQSSWFHERELRSVLLKSQACRTVIAADVYAKLGNTTAWESRESEGDLFAGATP
jgi:hypothetical protein